MQTLYKKDSKGKVRSWSIWFDEVDDNIVVASGLIDGKKVFTKTPIKSGKNIGKVNETSVEEQAYKDIQSEVDKKLCEGYVKSVSDLNDHGITGSGCPAPMLANKYDPTGKQSGSKTLDQLGLKNQLVGVSPKLDGNRCIAHISCSEYNKRLQVDVTLFTRKGKPFFDIPHIKQTLIKEVTKFGSLANIEAAGLSKDIYLDGELYTNQVSFNELNGILKRKKRSIEDDAQLSKVEYHLYDIMLAEPYSIRKNLLPSFIGSKIKLVPCFELFANEKNLQRYLEAFLEDKWEGCMIRQLNLPYQNKRTNQLLKYKIFEDAEFVVAGFKESLEGNTLGSILFHIKNANQKVFAARYKATDTEQLYIWENQDKFLGKTMTVEYFGLSEYGIPRFPVAKGFRDL